MRKNITIKVIYILSMHFFIKFFSIFAITLLIEKLHKKVTFESEKNKKFAHTKQCDATHFEICQM